MNKLVASIAAAIVIAIIATAPQTTRAQAPLQLVWKTKMKFGDAASSIDGTGTIVIDAVNNTRTVTGSAYDFGGTWQRGKFQLIGKPKAFVVVTLPSSFTLTNGNGNYSIIVDNITMNLSNPIKLSKKGKKNIFIGGRVNITTNQKGKTYGTGVYSIDADYL